MYEKQDLKRNEKNYENCWARKTHCGDESNAWRLRGISGIRSPKTEKDLLPLLHMMTVHNLILSIQFNQSISAPQQWTCTLQSKAMLGKKKDSISASSTISAFQSTNSNVAVPDCLFSYHAASRNHFTRIRFQTVVCISVLIPFPNCTELQHGYDPTNCNLPELELSH